MKRSINISRVLKDFYNTMYKEFGPQGWWPGRTRFEIIAGAILTQNTSWSNVEKAIKNLKNERLLTPERMHGVTGARLATHIKSAGYFNVKAKRLKNFLSYLFDSYNGNLGNMLKGRSGTELRRELLGINGIGPETADSIVLYAAGLPEFVVDAYTRRIFSRHGLIRDSAGYEEIKSFFMGNLKPDTRLFNEYHALIVKTGKDFCRGSAPLCGLCPLNRFL